MLMNRRQFFNVSFKVMIGGLIGRFSGIKAEASIAYPRSAFAASSIEQILNQLFETSYAGDDASIAIRIPREAEHRELVPFRMSAPGAEKIAVIVDNNPQPLVMVMTIATPADGVVMGTLKMKTDSYISCYAMKQGQLYRAARWVRISQSGYQDQ